MAWRSELNPNTVPAMLEKRSRECPRAIAYCFPEWGQRYTWGAIWEDVQSLAIGLQRLGVRKSDKVALLMTGRMEMIVAMYAAACLGAIVVPLNAYSRKEELTGYLAEAAPSVLLLGSEGHKQHYPAMAKEILDEYGARKHNLPVWLPGPERIFVVGDEEAAASNGFRSYRELAGGAMRTDEEQKAFRSACSQVDSRDPLVLLFTSGTLGAPKGVLRTTASFLARSAGSNQGGWISAGMAKLNTKVTQFFKIMNLLPLYHMGGFAAILTTLGSAAVCTVMLSRFNPVQALEITAKERCRVLVGTPYMLQGMIAAPERKQYDLSSLLGVAFTSAAVNPTVIEKVTGELKLRFFLVTYGSSEAGVVASGTCMIGGGIVLQLLYRMLKQTNLIGGLIPYKRFLQESCSLAGKVDSGIEIRIEDPVTGRALPLGEQGEILIRGHRVMRYIREDAERTCHQKDGWYRSGDLGWLDEHNQLTIAGRMHRIISRGGEKISPVEIENAILRLRDVEDVMVLGIPDELYGEQICACVVPKPGAKLSADRLRADLAPYLSAFKLPKETIFLPSLPMSGTGKVSVAEMKLLAMSELGLLRRHA
ncbi:class I adenylate-forming enzyme family protein [Paenibacillus sp. LHD-117]|uniref:class I adenylate-forming enzyme family protein n=1 Tax=Paenibacillus sp. LHD-117 TaxID=3071412 RepID=UPI0027DF312E|nr:class I adenylate-forming enzyme family protein [Paenibacillus sp. LHD-117]MDQ6419981.1 class I adenylate-forming enzyme family protein [Paenibacillus sp. LHD-117]